MCQKVLIANLNAVADSAGPDGNIHKEQSGQGQHCLPSYTGSFNSVKLKPKLNSCVVVLLSTAL